MFFSNADAKVGTFSESANISASFSEKTFIFFVLTIYTLFYIWQNFLFVDFLTALLLPSAERIAAYERKMHTGFFLRSALGPFLTQSEDKDSGSYRFSVRAFAFFLSRRQSKCLMRTRALCPAFIRAKGRNI